MADPSLKLLGLNAPRPSDEFVYAPRPASGSFGPSRELTSDLTLLVARTPLRAFLGR